MAYQYEFTRTIRFNLKSKDIAQFKKFFPEEETDFQGLFDSFQIKFADLLAQFKKAVFYPKNGDSLMVKNSLEIKKIWLRQYAREEFYNINERQRTHNKFLASLFQKNLVDWFEKNKKLFERLKTINQLPQDCQLKRSELLALLKEINSADNFLFIKNFVQPGVANDKKSDSDLENLKDKVGRFEELLNKALFVMAPDLSQGVEVSRASLSYYTVNKISKRDFDQELKNKEADLNEPYNKKLNQQFLQRVGFFDYLKDEYQCDIQNISIQSLYQALKNFKAQKKSEFMQAVQERKQAKELIKDFPLFIPKEAKDMQKFIDISRQIDNKNYQKQRSHNEYEKKQLAKEIKDLKIKRGQYFRESWGFSNYINFCNNIFKPVAIDIGKLKAQIRSIEQEKIEARLLRYWAHIFKKGNKYFLLLVPKENMQQVKNFLDNISSKQNGEYALYSFNSLTLRALKKLIRRNLGKEQARLRDEAVALCQEVLRGKYSELRNIDFSGFEEDIKEISQKHYDSEESFRLDLERVAYCCFEKKLNEENVKQLCSNFNALLLEISAYDFERNIVGKMKEHSEIWKKFWTAENKNQNFPVRLNPEIRIFYHPQRQQDDPKKQKNRFANEHLGVAFTITQNAAQKNLDLAFVKEKEISKAIKKFNEEVVDEFVQERGDNLYYYGIDRGNQELATLCVVKFSKEQGEVKLVNGEVRKFNIPVSAPIKLYRIKEDCLNSKKEIIIDRRGNKKIVTMFENPSYFIDEEEKFDEIESACIDLTTAKLIKNKIVLNGDVNTYLELKKANGKRQLYEKLSEIDDNAKIEFYKDEKERRLQIKSKPTEKNSYQYIIYYSPENEKIMSHEKMQRYLQDYLDYLRADNLAKEYISIEKINHLRDAITANMVGIIAFLFKQYPGIINLENLVETHSKKNNENIERRLEWSLYKKFQKFGLVPPQLRQTVLLRKGKEEDNQCNQLGIIHFVPEKDTSARCPFCGNTMSMSVRKEDKFKYHNFVCDKCGFDTQKPGAPFNFIKNSDDIAAYNIATKQLKDNG